jgi:DNA-binding SARP family transcriptional activator
MPRPAKAPEPGHSDDSDHSGHSGQATTPAAPASTTSAAAPEATLCLLGAPCLVLGGRRVPLSAKDAALLALAALAGPIRGERVAALLWPAATTSQAETSLRQRLYRLRRERGAPLVTGGAMLQLAADVDTDLPVALQRLAADEHAALESLLGDFDYDALPELADWVRGQRQRWREQCEAALASAASECEKAGAVARGLVFAQRLVDANPLAEHAQRRLMRLHYLRGDRAAAIAAFEQFEQRLKHELGARPSAETIELLATVERGASTLPARRAVTPASLMHPPRLVGRATELQALQRAWAAQHVFLLLGEAGIGKSRLLQEFLRDQPGVLAVQARQGDANLPYALLARLLRALLAAPALKAALASVLQPSPAPALAAPSTPGLSPAPGAERRAQLALVLPELGAAVAVAGAAQPLLLQRAAEALLADAMAAGLSALCIDDLHFADGASLECLQVLSLGEALATLRWGLAQRPAETSPALHTWREALVDAQRLETVVLPTLSQPQLAELVECIGLPELEPVALAAALLRHTGGNPMFALETLKDMVLSGTAGSGAGAAAGAGGANGPAIPGAPASAGVATRLPQPATVGALVERRLAQLSPAALKLARVAALAGADFHVELAAAVLDAHPLDIAEPWRELEAAQVLRDSRFAHDLIEEAARASVPQPIARLLHQRIARHLQASGAPAAALAPHWAGAQAWLPAAQAHAAAARLAQAASQRAHEVEHWQSAAAAFDRAGDSGRAFEARCDSVPALIVVRGVAHARGVIDALLAAARTPAQHAAALTARATAALMAADPVAGIAAATAAGALARGLDSPWPAFEAARLHAVGLALGGRAAEGLAVIEPYQALVEGEGTPEQRSHFWADYAYVLNTARRLRDTAVALQQAIGLAQSLGDLAELATLTSNLATVKGNLGECGPALALARQALALQAQVGSADGPTGAVVQTYVGLYCGMAGQYAEALQHFDAALACFARDAQAVWTAVAANHKAQLLLDLGQFARARQALEHPPAPVDHVRARSATIAARISRAQGQSGQPELQTALALLGPGADPLVRMHTLIENALAPETATQPQAFDEVLAMALQLEFAGVAMKVRLLRAQAQARAGQAPAAAVAMRELVALLPRVQPADMTLGQAWWLAAQVFDASGDGDQALMALAHGAQWVRRVALPQVPEDFRESFLQRNPSNRALLAAADRRLSA